MRKIKDFAAYVARSNKKFISATKTEQRVMIARDVIARLEARNIVANRGAIILLPDKILSKHNNEDSFKEVLNDKDNPPCQVCAKGALFCSAVGRTNKSSVWEVNMDMYEPIFEFFSKKQIDLIETAFEGMSYMALISERDEKIARDFCINHSGDIKERMIAIMKNIINNNGTFKP